MLQQACPLRENKLQGDTSKEKGSSVQIKRQRAGRLLSRLVPGPARPFCRAPLISATPQSLFRPEPVRGWWEKLTWEVAGVREELLGCLSGKN